MKFEIILPAYFHKNTKLILGLSGGPDSVFLGEMLFKAKYKNVTAAHFNHKLRGTDSDEDEKFCKEISAKWGFDFVSDKWKTPINSEEKARNARHNFLQKILKNKNAEVLLLAHHKDDVVETVIFNFLRGTGVKGLAGIDIFDPETKISRPLLDLTKKEILDYLKKNKIKYREDRTNKEDKYSRNFIRNKLIPLMESKFSKCSESIYRMSNIFYNLDEYLSHESKKWLKENKKTADGFDRKKFIILPIAFQSEIIRNLWSPNNLDFEQVLSIVKFIQEGASGKKMQIAKKTAKIFGDNFFIENI